MRTILLTFSLLIAPCCIRAQVAPLRARLDKVSLTVALGAPTRARLTQRAPASPP